MERVFISYRRDDSGGYTGRLYDRLRDLYPPGSLFMDVVGIQPGVDFYQAIEDAVGQCGSMVVVMGPKWLTVTDETGQRRIDNASDFVRLEIATALKRRVPVMIALVADASKPAEESLPSEMHELARVSVFLLRDTQWNADVQALVAALRPNTS